MYGGNRIGVVVPAYNEEELILDTLSGIPAYVDIIFCINDASTDSTPRLIESQRQADDRIVVIDHPTNQGLGQSLVDGYLASLNTDVDITAVMAGDNQMHPDDLARLLERLIDEGFDYVKGNRLLHQNVDVMPRYRFFGNAILTILTKFATGYYSLMDPQCGYTAIRNRVLQDIPISRMTKGYGYNADILCMLNIRRFRVTDVQVKPVYGKEVSKINLWNYIPKTSWLLIRLFIHRLWWRYVILDFHPLVLFYAFAMVTTCLVVVPLGIRFFVLFFALGEAPQTTLIILVFAFMIVLQSILFAIWMDMDYNRAR